jgi:hypothetical protein
VLFKTPQITFRTVWAVKAANNLKAVSVAKAVRNRHKADLVAKALGDFNHNNHHKVASVVKAVSNSKTRMLNSTTNHSSNQNTLTTHIHKVGLANSLKWAALVVKVVKWVDTHNSPDLKAQWFKEGLTNTVT